MRLSTIGPNAHVISNAVCDVLFSYATPVAARTHNGFFRTAERHSVTTSRHINAWLDGRSAAELPQSWFDGLTINETEAR